MTCTGLQQRWLPDGRLEVVANVKNRESRPAQFAVPETKLVEAVRELLARHGIRWD